MEIKDQQLFKLLDCLQKMYFRGNVESGEVEYILNILFNFDYRSLNEILGKWEKNRSISKN